MNETKTTLKIPKSYIPLITDLRLLKGDGDNPNRMTLKQHEELWESLQDHGWTSPIVTDQNLIFLDGEQRVQVCLSHGEYFGPVLQLAISDVKRRLARQRLNKLKGKHSRNLDAQEYVRLVKAGERAALERMLNAIGERVPNGLLNSERVRASIPELYEIIVECKDEADQKAKFERFVGEGLKVRILTL